MKMTRREILEHDNDLAIVLKLECELNAKIVYAARRTKNRLSLKAVETRELIEDSRKCEQQLDLKYCDKDNDGKPVISKI